TGLVAEKNRPPRETPFSPAGKCTLQSPPSAVIVPSREQRSSSVLSSTNFLCLSSIFHALTAGRISAPFLFLRTPIAVPGISRPRRAFLTSDPQRTESKPSASQTLLMQTSGRTRTKIPKITFVFINSLPLTLGDRGALVAESF